MARVLTIAIVMGYDVGMNTDPKVVMAEAEALVESTLKECCEELVRWRKTALLTGDHVRAVARVLVDLESPYSLTLAESLVVAAALRRVAEADRG